MVTSFWMCSIHIYVSVVKCQPHTPTWSSPYLQMAKHFTALGHRDVEKLDLSLRSFSRLQWFRVIFLNQMTSFNMAIEILRNLAALRVWNSNIFFSSPHATHRICHTQVTPGGVTVCLAAFAETQLRCRKRSCAQLVQLRAANAASAARAPIRSTIGSMGPQKPNEQYIERRWRSRRSQRSQRSWCSCAQPTQPAHPELQFEVL